MNYRERMREQINKYPYGEYYGLKPNQPKDIIRLLNEMDRSDEVIKNQFFKIDRLNNVISELMEDIPCLLEIINRNEKDIKVYQDEWIAVRSLEYRLKQLKEKE